MTESSFHIRPIETKDIPAVEHLLAMQLGSGFMDAIALEKFVNQKDNIGFVAKHNDQIVGAAFAQTFPIHQIEEHLKLETEQIKEIFSNQQQIGITKTITTFPEYAGKGIGFALMAERMKWFEQHCEAVICMCWEESNSGMQKNID